MVTAKNLTTGATITVTSVDQLPAGPWQIISNGVGGSAPQTTGPNCACQTCPPGAGQRGAPNISQGTFQVEASPVCSFEAPGPMTYTIKPCLQPLVVDCYRTAMYQHPYLGVFACDGEGSFELLKVNTCPTAMSYIYVTDPNLDTQAFWIMNNDGSWEKQDAVTGLFVLSNTAPTCPLVVYINPFDTGANIGTLYYYAPVTEQTQRTALTSGSVCPEASS